MFKIGDKVSLPIRSRDGNIRSGWGKRRHIPVYSATVLSVDDTVIMVECPKYSHRPLAVTLRKSGNWILKGEPEDGSPCHMPRGPNGQRSNGSRVAMFKYEEELEAAE